MIKLFIDGDEEELISTAALLHELLSPEVKVKPDSWDSFCSPDVKRIIDPGISADIIVEDILEMFWSMRKKEPTVKFFPMKSRFSVYNPCRTIIVSPSDEVFIPYCIVLYGFSKVPNPEPLEPLFDMYIRSPGAI